MKSKQSPDVLFQAIHEYLLKSGFLNTLDVFQHEMSAARPKANESQSLAQILKAVDSGDAETFFRLWGRFLPSQSTRGEEGQKLEFYAHVLFAVYSLHPLNKSRKTDESEHRRRMDDFREFLNTKGSDLSKSEEFLHFYALPYIPNPSEHVSFKILFTRGWITEFKEKLTKFFKAHAPSNQQPLLVQMHRAYLNSKGKSQPRGNNPAKQNDEEVAALKQELGEVQTQLNELQEKEEYARTTLLESQAKWTNFSIDILEIAKELYSGIESLQRGQNISQPLLSAIHEKMVRYDQFLSRSEEISGNGSFTYSPIERSYSEISLSPNRRDEGAIPPIHLEKSMIKGYSSLPQLNYAMIIRDLSSIQDEIQMCTLLQALRWRITRSQAHYRRTILEIYQKYNLLCTAKPHDTLLDKLLTWTGAIKEYTLRLLNAIASEAIGRQYLLTKENLIEILTGIMFEEKRDTSLRQNALGTLQKLSLKREAQSKMIELDMINWLGRLLKHESKSIGSYSLEYATALLMNLSLRTKGKDMIERSSTDIMAALVNLFEHENAQVKTYVNGTLYSILTRKSLKEHASKMNLERMLLQLMQESDEHFQKQIQYILTQMKSEQDDLGESDENDDDVDDREEGDSELDDYIMEDEDMDDKINGEFLMGEDLLVQRYATRAPSVNKSPFQSEKPPSRPITPRNKEDRNVPSEMKKRDILPRTPLAANKSSFELDESMQEPTPKPPAPPVEQVTDPPINQIANDTGEFSYAFKSRDKIPRSPFQY